MISHVRKTLKEKSLAPKKWLGQNLLTDPHYLKKIVDVARVDKGDQLVEIGSGLGALTDELLLRGAHVVAMEIDSGFFRVLQERFASEHRIRLVHANALKYDFRSLYEKLGKLRVVANLPYSISSRLVFKFHENSRIFDSLYVLLQKEVAERFIAPPGNKEYGILSVLLATSSNVDLLFDIPPGAFFPIPAVVSTLVRIEFPAKSPIPVKDPALLASVVKSAFRTRRKTLRNAFGGARVNAISPELISIAAKKAGIDLGSRAETLRPQDFARLTDELSILANQRH